MWIGIRPKLYIVTRMWRGMKTGYKCENIVCIFVFCIGQNICVQIYVCRISGDNTRVFVSKYLGYRVSVSIPGAYSGLMQWDGCWDQYCAQTSVHGMCHVSVSDMNIDIDIALYYIWNILEALKRRRKLANGLFIQCKQVVFILYKQSGIWSLDIWNILEALKR